MKGNILGIGWMKAFRAVSFLLLLLGRRASLWSIAMTNCQRKGLVHGYIGAIDVYERLAFSLWRGVGYRSTVRCCHGIAGIILVTLQSIADIHSNNIFSSSAPSYPTIVAAS